MCFSQMKECPADSLQGHQMVFQLADQLKTKVDFFCSSHLKVKKQDFTSNGANFDIHENIMNQKNAEISRLESQLRLQKKKNRKLIKANIKHKKKVRGLRNGLVQLVERLLRGMNSSASEFRSTFVSKIQSLKTVMNDKSEEMIWSSRSAQHEYQRSIELVMRELREMQEQDYEESEREEDQDIHSRADEAPSEVSKLRDSKEEDHHVHGPNCSHHHDPAQTNPKSEETGHTHIHGPNCNHNHAPPPQIKQKPHTQKEHVHGPNCNHNHSPTQATDRSPVLNTQEMQGSIFSPSIQFNLKSAQEELQLDQQSYSLNHLPFQNTPSISDVNQEIQIDMNCDYTHSAPKLSQPAIQEEEEEGEEEKDGLRIDMSCSYAPPPTKDKEERGLETDNGLKIGMDCTYAPPAPTEEKSSLKIDGGLKIGMDCTYAPPPAPQQEKKFKFEEGLEFDSNFKIGMDCAYAPPPPPVQEKVEELQFDNGLKIGMECTYAPPPASPENKNEGGDEGPKIGNSGRPAPPPLAEIVGKLNFDPGLRISMDCTFAPPPSENKNTKKAEKEEESGHKHGPNCNHNHSHGTADMFGVGLGKETPNDAILSTREEDLLFESPNKKGKPQREVYQHHEDNLLSLKDNQTRDDSNQNDNRDIEDLELEIEVIQQTQEEGVFVGDWTHLAMRNQNSYMTLTEEDGMVLVEDGEDIYTGKFPTEEVPPLDIIYIEHFECYLMNFDDKVYRKDINDQPPYVYMNIHCGTRVGACFRYSKLHQRLIVNKDYENITAVNLHCKDFMIEVEKDVGEDIYDFRVFGEQEDRIISITRDGYVVLYHLDYEKDTGCVKGHSKIELKEDRKEELTSVAVCEKGQFTLVEIGRHESEFISSRMLVFKIEEDKLVKKASLDQFYLKMGQKFALECYGHVGTHVLWVGLTGNEEGAAQVYDYDSESQELKELVENRELHEEYDPVKLVRLEKNQFCYAGNRGKVMSLSFVF